MLSHTQKKLLQLTVAMACLVPLSAGLWGMLAGSAMLAATPAGLDSHFRYLSGLLFAIGLGFASAIPNIERNTTRIRLLTFIVVIGGIGRLIGLIYAIPDTSMLLALAMELVVTPAICWWQGRVAKNPT